MPYVVCELGISGIIWLALVNSGYREKRPRGDCGARQIDNDIEAMRLESDDDGTSTHVDANR